MRNKKLTNKTVNEPQPMILKFYCEFFTASGANRDTTDKKRTAEYLESADGFTQSISKEGVIHLIPKGGKNELFFTSGIFSSFIIMTAKN